MPDSAKKARSRGIYLLPNLLTTLALFAGFYAIVAAIDGNFVGAGVAVFVAMAMDGADGRVARMTSTQSDFGKEYDSLSDMVSFGLAPAVVVYQWGVARLTEYSIAWGRIGWLVAFLFAVTAALRLARFNSSPAKLGKGWFQGLPSPSAAALVAAFVWLSAEHGIGGFGGLVAAFVVRGRVSFAYLLLVPLIIALISIHPPLVLFLLFLTYALSGPVLWFLTRNPARVSLLDDDGEAHADDEVLDDERD